MAFIFAILFKLQVFQMHHIACIVILFVDPNKHFICHFLCYLLYLSEGSGFSVINKKKIVLSFSDEIATLGTTHLWI